MQEFAAFYWERHFCRDTLKSYEKWFNSNEFQLQWKTYEEQAQKRISYASQGKK